MPIFRLGADPGLFPDPELSEPSGLLAVGGDLSPDRLLAAYAKGIFPWYEDGQPLLWWSPHPRMVLQSSDLHVSRSLRKTLRSGQYQIRFDTVFARVINACADRRRPRQSGTWITDEMIQAYVRLHALGYAHSAEAWQNDELVGGLYGVCLGGVFFGESMYADAPDASKSAFVVLVQTLADWGINLVDCQVTTPHLLRFGAREMPRAEFLARVRAAMKAPTLHGPWRDAPTVQATTRSPPARAAAGPSRNR